MSQETNMGNCKSKRQETTSNSTVDCECQQEHSDIIATNVETTNEEVHSQSAQPSNLSSPNVRRNNSPGKRHDDKSLQKQQIKPAQQSSSHKTANDAVIDSTRAEVNTILEGISNFQGTSQNDKDYRYFDEMLTRCILRLDTIECNDSRDRTNRKEAIRGVNEAISILERKVAFNSDIRDLESDLQQKE